MKLKRVKKIPKGRKCYNCKSKESYKIKGKHELWFNYNGHNHLCLNCYGKLIHYPKYYKQNYKKIREYQKDYYYRVTRRKLGR